MVTGVHHWLEVVCSGFCTGAIELCISSYTLKIYFCKSDAKMPRPLPVKHLDSGSCRVQEGYRSLVFTYHLEFPLRAITNATQIFSVGSLTQSTTDKLVHLTLLSNCLGPFVSIERQRALILTYTSAIEFLGHSPLITSLDLTCRAVLGSSSVMNPWQCFAAMQWREA